MSVHFFPIQAISPNLTETEFCNWFLEDEKAAQEWYSEFEVR